MATAAAAPTTTATPPHPAPAILASDELEALLAGTGAVVKQKLSTGTCSAVDDACLDGGLRVGEIHVVSGGAGMGKSMLALHLLACFLLHDERDAVVIDTTGAFSVVRLRDVLLLHLRQDPGEEEEERQRRLGILLDRVRIMRCFDFLGVKEGVDEVRDLVERVRGERGEGEVAVGIIVIDNVTNIFSGLLSKSQIEGHAQMLAFLRSLRLFTRHHGVYTLLLNAAVQPFKQPASDAATSTTPGSVSTSSVGRRPPDEDVSIFASTTGKPALGAAFAAAVDVHLFLSSVPRDREDAERVNGGAGGGEAGRGRGGDRSGVEWAGVLEVIKDRGSGREGRWGAFQIDGVQIKDAF